VGLSGTDGAVSTDASVVAESGLAGAAGAGGNNAGGSGSIADARAADRSDLVDRITSCHGPLSETIIAPPCGTIGATTVNAFSGIATVTVRGIIGNTANFDDVDAFYYVVQNDDSIPIMPFKPCDGCVRFDRVSEGACVCAHDCPAHNLIDVLIGGYPSFQSTNEYTVQVDFGPQVERLNFGFGDCGCSDNLGSYTVTIVSEGTCDQ